MYQPCHARSLVGLTVLFALLLFASTVTAATPEGACAAAKVKAAMNEAKGELGCWGKAIGKAVAVDPECLQKAEDKYAKAFDKAEAKGPCTSKSADAIQTLVETFTSNVVQAVQCFASGSICGGSSQCCSGSCVPSGGPFSFCS
jgi:hypothetical protein